MPSFSLGLAQVEVRLGVVRRRLNLLTLQDALYLSGSLVALAAALVVALALRGRAGWFAVAFWAALAAVAAAIVAAALRISRRWLSVAEVVRYADRQAALDDRLATLLSDPPRVRNSRFREVLLEQILAAAPRWDVDTLAPRRVPRSVFALLTALAALAATSFFLRPPAIPLPGTATRPHQSDADDPSSVAGLRGDADPSADSPAPGGPGATMQMAGMRGAGAGLAPQHSSGPGLPTSGGPSAAASGQAAPKLGTGRDGIPNADGSADGDDKAPGAMTEKFQDAIRQALGAQASDRRKAGDGRPGGPDKGHGADAGDQAPGQLGRNSSEALKDALKKENGANVTQPPGASGVLPGTGSAAAPGARAAQATKELYGTETGARLAGSESQNLAIKLGTFAAMAPSEIEPQRHAPPVSDLTVGPAGHGDPAPLAEEQIPDAPLQKADVAPEHEALVRRIFTRDE